MQCIVYDGPDSQYTDREICFASNEDSVTIVDVTDKSNMVQISYRSYSGTGYTHQGWLTEDRNYFFFNDELDEYYGITSKTRTHVLDVSDLDNIVYAGYHDGRTNAIDHNLYVKGNLVYQAHYRAGLNILRHTGSNNFDEVGYFDIYPSSDTRAFNGAWSNYPYHASGVVTVSGIEQGLFILRDNLSGPPTPVTSSPTKAPVPITDSPTKAPVPITDSPTKAPVPITDAPTMSPVNFSCGDNVCHVDEGEGCGACPSDCFSPANCNMVSNSGGAVYSSGVYGIAFNADVGPKDLYFYELQVWLMNSGDSDVRVYMKDGAYTSETNLDNWTIVFDGTITRGSSSKADIRFDQRYFAEANSRVAFYLSYAAGAAFVYSNKGQDFSNSDITVKSGNSLRQRSGNTLPSTYIPNRDFLDGIKYDIGSGVGPSTDPPTVSPVKLTDSPTFSPVASPTSTCSCCEEMRSEMGEMEEMIERMKNIIASRTRSPIASGSAPTLAPVACTDRTGKWQLNGVGANKNWCKWAANLGTSNATANRCGKKDLYADCPKTCDRCP